MGQALYAFTKQQHDNLLVLGVVLSQLLHFYGKTNKTANNLLNFTHCGAIMINKMKQIPIYNYILRMRDRGAHGQSRTLGCLFCKIVFLRYWYPGEAVESVSLGLKHGGFSVLPTWHLILIYLESFYFEILDSN